MTSSPSIRLSRRRLARRSAGRRLLTSVVALTGALGTFAGAPAAQADPDYARVDNPLGNRPASSPGGT